MFFRSVTEFKILLTHVVLSALRYFVDYSRGFICDKSLKAKGLKWNSLGSSGLTEMHCVLHLV